MEYTWTIYNLDRIKSDGLVFEATYGCTASTPQMSTRKTYTQTFSGSPSEPNFIPYKDLTEDDVWGWINNSVDTTSIQLSVSASLALMVSSSNAQITEEGVPWNS